MAMRAKIEASLIETVAETAKKVAGSTSRRQLYDWIGAWGLSGAATFGLMLGWGYAAGSSSGYKRGHPAALDVNASAIWSASASSQQAFKLWQAGDVQHLSACDRPGWEIKDMCATRRVSMAKSTAGKSIPAITEWPIQDGTTNPHNSSEKIGLF
jgi:hypothetical protein